MYTIKRNRKYLKKIFSAIMCGVFFVTPNFVSAEEKNSEVDELLKQYEENLQEIERIAKNQTKTEKNEDKPAEPSKESPKIEDKPEVFDPDEEYFEVKKVEEVEEVQPPPPVHQEEVFQEIPEKKFSFDWRGSSLAQSIYGIAKIAGMGVVVNTEVKGTVYTSLKNVTCREALDYLGRAFNLLPKVQV